jgi:hypothetical protein
VQDAKLAMKNAKFTLDAFYVLKQSGLYARRTTKNYPNSCIPDMGKPPFKASEGGRFEIFM